MSPLVSGSIASWVIGGTVTFSLLLHVLKRGSEEDESFRKNPSVRTIMETRLGLIVLAVMCIILWPLMLIKLLWVTATSALSAWRRRRFEKKMAHAFDALSVTIAQLASDIDEPDRQKLVDAMKDLRQLMKGDSDESGEDQVQDEIR